MEVSSFHDDMVDHAIMSLAEMKTQLCTPATPRLEGEALAAAQKQLPDWTVVEGHHLYRRFNFPDFKSALEFVNLVGAVAEQEGHHPNISFTWGKVEITIFTHAIDGLSVSDFILAAKIQELRAAA